MVLPLATMNMHDIAAIQAPNLILNTFLINQMHRSNQCASFNIDIISIDAFCMVKKLQNSS